MLLHTEEETKAFATQIAHNLKSGSILALKGGLGAGKTTFAKYLIRTLVGDETLVVPSPTYTLLETYELPQGGVIWHYDAYRLEVPEDIFNTGFEEALSPHNFIIIEWPEKLGSLLPATAHVITFELTPNGQRQVTQQW